MAGRRTAVPHGRSGSLPSGRQSGVPRPRRSAGQGQRFPHRAWRDRSRFGSAPRYPASGGAALAGCQRTTAAGRLSAGRWRSAGQCRSARVPGAVAAGLHAPGGDRHAGCVSAHGQRQGRSACAARADRHAAGSPRGLPGTAKRSGNAAGCDLGRRAERGLARRAGQLLRSWRAFDAGRATGEPREPHVRLQSAAVVVAARRHDRAYGCAARAGQTGSGLESAGADSTRGSGRTSLLRASGRRQRALLLRTGTRAGSGTPVLRAAIARGRRLAAAARHHGRDGRRVRGSHPHAATARSVSAGRLVVGRRGGLRDRPRAGRSGRADRRRASARLAGDVRAGRIGPGGREPHPGDAGRDARAVLRTADSRHVRRPAAALQRSAVGIAARAGQACRAGAAGH